MPIRNPKKPQRIKCTKHKTNGEKCSAWAVTGKDCCQKHGGMTPIKHGLYSKYPACRPENQLTIQAKIAEIEANPKLMTAEHTAKLLLATTLKISEEVDVIIAAGGKLIDVPQLQTLVWAIDKAAGKLQSLEELAIKRGDQARRLLKLFCQAISDDLEAAFPKEHNRIKAIFLRDRQFDKKQIEAVDISSRQYRSQTLDTQGF